MDAMKVLGGLLGERPQAGGAGRVLHEVLQTATTPKTGERPGATVRTAGASGHVINEVLRDAHSRHEADVVFRQGTVAARPEDAESSGDRGKSFRAHSHQPDQQRRRPFSHGYDERDLQQCAKVLVRAMISAAKGDGQLDDEQKTRILSRLGNLSTEERDFLEAEFQTRRTVREFARTVPEGMERDVYAISLMTIDVDKMAQAHYLHELAECLRIDDATRRDIHSQYGVPPNGR